MTYPGGTSQDGGLADPLGAYEAAFSGLNDDPELWRRSVGRVPLRFP